MLEEIYDNDEYQQKEKGVLVSTFSKSSGERFRSCPLKAWYHQRKKVKEQSALMDFGKITHELFAQKVSQEYKREPYQIDLSMYPAEQNFEAKLLLDRFNLEKIIEQGDVVLGVEETFKEYLSNGIELIGIFDLIILKYNNGNHYIQIFDLKSGRRVAKERDLQCMIYMYLAHKKYPGYDISFVAYSIKTHDTWGDYLSGRDIAKMEQYLIEESSMVKEQVESIYKPVAKPSANKCLSCPYFHECESAAQPDSVEDLLHKLELCKATIKDINNELKNRRLQSEDKIVSETGHIIDVSESKFSKISTKNVNKENLLVLLSQRNGGLNSIIDSLDISLTDHVIDIAKREFKIDFKEQIKTTVVIKGDDEGDDEDE